MKAEHRHELETNALAEGAAKLVSRAKSGQLVSPRVLGAVLAVALVGGVWWYVSRTGRSTAATTWAVFADVMRTGGQTALEDFSKTNSTDTAGRLARVELARIKLASEGISQLPVRDVEQRSKAIASIEAARTELTELANEFRGDKTLQATCLLNAAEAELSLVGIAKTPGGSDYRGTVAATVELIRKAAELVGPTTTAGEALLKRAGDLESNKAQVEEVGVKLNNLLTPPPSLGPTDGLGTPKLPSGPIKDPAPPVVPKIESPKAPAGPVGTPPTATGTPATGR